MSKTSEAIKARLAKGINNVSRYAHESKDNDAITFIEAFKVAAASAFRIADAKEKEGKK